MYARMHDTHDVHSVGAEAEAGPFAELLRSVGWNEFFETYWGRRSLHIRDCQAQLQALPGLEEFPRILAGRLGADGWDQPFFAVQASFLDRGANPRGLMLMPGELAPAYNAGVSLCFGDVSRWNEALARLVADCRRSTRLCGEVAATAYLAPRGSGSGMHLDCQHVFFLQVSGEKHWKISRRAGIQAPPINLVDDIVGMPEELERLRKLGLDIEGPEACQLDELVLKAGEVLYLPPGFWHEARTQESPSLHYTLTLHTVSFAALFQMPLRLQVLAHTSWRRDLRSFTTDNARVAFLRERLAELHAAMGAMTADELLETYDRITALPVPTQRALSLAPRA